MITNVRMKNYKSIQEENIALKKVNFIIGGNNSGKSNFLDFFDLYSRLINWELQEVFGVSPFSFVNAFFQGNDFHLEDMEFKVNYQPLKRLAF